MSKNKTQFFEESVFISSGPTFSNEERWDLIPLWDLRIGLNYGRAFSCFSALIEVGYEVLSYQNAINRITPFDDVGGSLSESLYSDLNFQGPYIALEFVF